jgi:hypothetical protein
MAGATNEGSNPMSEGNIFDKAKDMAGGLKDKVTDALQPDDEQDQDPDQEQDDNGLQTRAQDALDDMRSPGDDTGPQGNDGMSV